MLSPVRLPVVCLSVTLVHPTQAVKFSVIFLRHLVPWSSADIQEKFYRDHSRVTPPSGDINNTGSQMQRYWTYRRLSQKRCKIGGKLVLITNRKYFMSFQLVSKSVTLNDIERRNGLYFALFQRIRWLSGAHCLYKSS